MTIAEYMMEAHATSVSKGWWESPVRTFGDQIALMHSELSEALEEFRTHGLETRMFLYCGQYADDNHMHGIDDQPEGIAAEFADVLIRIFDTCQHYGIPLQEALDAKMKFNQTRQHRHGGKQI